MAQRLTTILSFVCILVATLLCVGFVLGPESASAYQSPGQARGFVNDFAGVLTDQTKSSLEQTLSQFSIETSNQIVVVSVMSLEGDSIENYANELFREWAIGQKDKNNGVLLLIAPNEKRVRIEVGYGLEGAITDLQAGRIVSEILTPAFKTNDFDGGVTRAVDALAKASKGEYNEAQSASSSTPQDFWYLFSFIGIWIISFLARSKSYWAGGVIGLIVAIVGFIVLESLLVQIMLAVFAPIIGLLLDWVVSRNYKANIAHGGTGGFFSTRGGFSGGGGGGGFGGFGGGSSGGGSSGGW